MSNETTDSQLSTHGLSTPKIIMGAVEAIRDNCPELKDREIQHLDIGAGNGELIEFMSRQYKGTSYACDYTTELMQIPGQKVDLCDLNSEPLPYDDDCFDVVTFTEVIEHIENHRMVLREIFRVLKPGGHVVITTPNILNIKSRLRFLFFGFWMLFSPLHVRESKKYSTGGHINPISYFYVAHSLLDAGFDLVDERIDKVQRSGTIPFVLLYLPIRLFGALALLKEDKKYHHIDEHNRDIVKKMNGLDLLLGRTLIMSAKRPASQSR